MFYILFLPLVIVMLYYIGFIISDRRKIWKEDTTRNIIFRFLLGASLMMVLAFIAVFLYERFRIRY